MPIYCALHHRPTFQQLTLVLHLQEAWRIFILSAVKALHAIAIRVLLVVLGTFASEYLKFSAASDTVFKDRNK